MSDPDISYEAHLLEQILEELSQIRYVLENGPNDGEGIGLAEAIKRLSMPLPYFDDIPWKATGESHTASGPTIADIAKKHLDSQTEPE